MIPNEFDTIYLRKQKGGGTKVHAPSDREDEPICVTYPTEWGNTPSNTEWRDKDSAVIPDGHYPDCTKCLDILERRNFEEL